MKKHIDPTVKAMMLQAKRSAAKQATDDVVRTLIAIPVLVLHDKWGFGQKRLERFVVQMVEVLDSYEKGLVSMDDLMDVLKDEAGIDLRERPKG